jgi:hypothetical protein
MFQIFYQSQSSHIFLYKLVTYHWKGFEKSYNFVVELCSWKYFNQNSHEKIMFTQSLKHMLFGEHGLGCSSPKEFLLGGTWFRLLLG